MDVLDVCMPIDIYAAEEIEFIRAELSAFLADSALGFYRRQHTQASKLQLLHFQLLNMTMHVLRF
jgi:hypothetical protein